MTEEERWNHLLELDEELLKGGVLLSEWCSLIVREADTAFVNGAYLAAILTAVAAIETHLRSERQATGANTLRGLINNAFISNELKNDLHGLRRYRNKWVHVEEPWEDRLLLESPELYEKELEQMAFVAIRLLRTTLYANPWV